MLNGVQLVGTNFRKNVVGAGCSRAWVRSRTACTAASQEDIFWHRKSVREKMEGLGCAFGAGLWNVDLVASVVFGSGTHVSAVYTMQYPGAAIVLGFKHEYSGSWGGQGVFN